MTFTQSNETREGISVPILTEDGGRGVRWKRADGFGHMSDAQVQAYKDARPRRYGQAAIMARLDKLEVSE